jgi:hypothetical protein
MDILRFVLSQTLEAVLAAALFFIGAGLAPAVHSRRIEFLLSFPRWMMRRLQNVIRSKPPTLKLGAYIFAFNGTAMFVYMLTGLIPGVPYLIALMTGLNVALAGLLAREEPRAVRPEPGIVPASVRLCMMLTFLLELPCFWYAMAMGFTMPTVISLLGDGDPNEVRRRIEAYLIVILPILAVSASVEAHAVLWAARHDAGEA